MVGFFMKRGLVFFCLVLVLVGLVNAANYPMKIVRPAAGIGEHDRIYKAYPGITYTTETVVFGGTYPFSYSLSNEPVGMTIDEDTGKIAWTNPQSAANNIQVTVTDAEGNVDSATWSIAVGTSGFYFVDADAGDGGDGSYENPWNSISDFYLGWSDTTYQDAIIYFYTGTYAMPYAQNHGTEHSSYRIDFNSRHPVALLEYPGETVTIDMDQGNPCMFYVTRDNFYIDGITMNDCYSHCVLVPTGTVVDYLTFFNCGFTDMTGSGDNIAAITYYGDGPIQNSAPSTDSGFSLYPVVQGCNFNNIMATGISAICDYGTKYLVLHDNIVTDVSSYAGFTFKSSNTHTMVRANIFDNAANAVRIMAQYYASNIDISFNNFIDSNIQVGQYSGNGGPENIHIYRNTIDGSFNLEQINDDDGPIYILNNIIVNSNPDDHIRDTEHYSVTADKTVLSDNLMGYPSDNLVDSGGNLVDRSLVGIYGWEIDSEVSTCVGDGDCGSRICCNGHCVIPPACSCDDGDECTVDSCVGGGTCNPTCSNVRIDECVGGDGCCASGCTVDDDSDCSPGEEEPEPVEGACEGMRLLMRFDEDSVNQIDESGAGNNGVVVGGTFVSDGRFGGAYDFDGVDDYVSLSSEIVFDDGGSFGFWFNADGVNNVMPLGQIDGDNHFAIRGAVLRIQDNGNSNLDWVVSSVGVGEWHYVVVTKDGSDDWRLYLDGAESSTGAINDEDVFLIGAIGQGYTDDESAFDGRIDEVGVWDRVLNSSEIAGIYSSGIVCEVDPGEECVAVTLAEVGLKIEEWKSGEVGIDAVLDVVEGWKIGC